MVKVERVGLFRAVCLRCNCELSYAYSDVRKVQQPSPQFGVRIVPRVICPNCGHDVKHRAIRIRH